jgi:hypothetical protein
VVKEAGAIRDVKVTAIHDDSKLWRSASLATTTFTTSGNVAVVPRGVISVYDPLGRSVGDGVVNEESLQLLPKSELKLQAKINPSSMSLLPGRYTTKIVYRYDGSDNQMVATVRHVVIPPLSVLFGLMILFIAAGLIMSVRRILARRVKSTKNIVADIVPKSRVARPRKNIDGIVRPPTNSKKTP